MFLHQNSRIFFKLKLSMHFLPSLNVKVAEKMQVFRTTLFNDINIFFLTSQNFRFVMLGASVIHFLHLFQIFQIIPFPQIYIFLKTGVMRTFMYINIITSSHYIQLNPSFNQYKVHLQLQVKKYHNSHFVYCTLRNFRYPRFKNSILEISNYSFLLYLQIYIKNFRCHKCVYIS